MASFGWQETGVAGGSIDTTRVLGIVLIVAGTGLAFWAYQMSGEFGARVTETFSGSLADGVTVRYVGGAASFLVGIYLVLKG